MAYYRALTTFDTAGLRTINAGFQPTGYRITAGQQFGVTDTIARFSEGGSDGTRQHYLSLYTDSTRRQTLMRSGKVLSLYGTPGGVFQEILAATHNAITPTGPQVNVTIPNVNYQVIVEVWS